MKKESRVVLTEAQHEALTLAAERGGMALATFIRSAALSVAANAGIQPDQPRAD
tara:strand:+ start:651 stop:812 length:162 start_codon:yes stop_codon:yes gene_type:complete